MQIIDNLDDVLTAKEVAVFIKRSYKTTLRLIKEKKIKAINDGTRGYRIRKKDLLIYLGEIPEEKKEDKEPVRKKIRRR